MLNPPFLCFIYSYWNYLGNHSYSIYGRRILEADACLCASLHGVLIGWY